MSNSIFITESTATTLKLTGSEVEKLLDVGKALSSKTLWWTDSDDEGPSRSLIDVRRTKKPGVSKVFVRNAIGVINLGDRNLIVEPKIPADHFMYIAKNSIGQPRLSSTKTSLSSGDNFVELLAHWFVSSMQDVVNGPLNRDYETLEEQSQTIRGSVKIIQSTMNYYRGSLSISMDSDELTVNTPLNRVLKSALMAVCSWNFLSLEARREASRCLTFFDGVDDFVDSDLQIQIFRNQFHLKNVFELACSILGGSFRNLKEGNTSARTFLLPTPMLIQKGITEILRKGLSGFADVNPRKLSLNPPSFTVNPDLVFEQKPSFVIDNSLITGDVKYKLDGEQFNRNDFNQAVTFATAFDAPGGLVVTFGYGSVDQEQTVEIGKLHISRLRWDVSQNSNPESQAEIFVSSVREEILWLKSNISSIPKLLSK